MIYIAAVTQFRLDTEGRTYYGRKRAEGKKPMEAMRCLRRRISDAVYHRIRRFNAPRPVLSPNETTS